MQHCFRPTRRSEFASREAVSAKKITYPHIKISSPYHTFPSSCVSFHITGNLKGHMLTHNGEKPYSCNECSYKCTQAVALKKHKFTHSGEKPFACKQCSYKYRLASHLEVHMFTHTGEKPIACKQCKYSCTSSSSLKKHMKKHSAK